MGWIKNQIISLFKTRDYSKSERIKTVNQMEGTERWKETISRKHNKKFKKSF